MRTGQLQAQCVEVDRRVWWTGERGALSSSLNEFERTHESIVCSFLS